MKIKQNFISFMCEENSITVSPLPEGRVSLQKASLNELLHVTSNHYDEQTKTQLSLCVLRSYAHYDPLKRENKLCITHTLLGVLSLI